MRKERGKIVALVLMLLALILSIGLGIAVSRRREEIAAQRDRDRLQAQRAAPGGARPVLGVEIEDRNGAIIVSRVAPGMPAEAGGMKAGDVIKHIGAQPVRIFDDVPRALECMKAGDGVVFVVDRNGSQLSLPVVLGEPSSR